MRNTKEEIVQTARNLFARYGFDGVSTRMLAGEVGISVATLNYHIGSKDQLYGLIFKDAFIEEEALVMRFYDSVTESVLNDAEQFRDALLGFVNDHIDLLNQFQAAPRLWLRRWVAEPDSKIAQIDVDFGRHLYQKVRDLLRRAQEAGTLTRPFNMRYFMMSFTWMEYGFFSGGSLGNIREKSPNSPDSESIKQFKTHMQLYVCNMLGLAISAELQAAASQLSSTIPIV